MPKGSDSSWAEKLYAKCSQRTHFVKPRFGEYSFIFIYLVYKLYSSNKFNLNFLGTNSFIVKHFADKVEYDVSGFLEKNRDTVIEEQVSSIKCSRDDLSPCDRSMVNNCVLLFFVIVAHTGPPSTALSPSPGALSYPPSI